MSSPDPVAPAPAPLPPPRKRNTLLIGCLIILVLLVLGGLAVFLLTLYAAKREYDKVAPEAAAAMEGMRDAARQAEQLSKLAPIYAQGLESQTRLAMATQYLPQDGSFEAVPCPPDPARVSIPVDAEWFRALPGGVPRERIGTPWQRHRIFGTLAEQPFADPSDEKLALATAAADRELSDAGTLAVIHTSTLVMPAGGKPGRFEGFVQLLKYPTGESICLAPFSADSPAKPGGGLGPGRRARGLPVGAARASDPQLQAEEDFQGSFWAAQQAALGK